MRVAILQTDSVRDEFRPSHGDYPDMFTTLFEDASSAEDSATDIVTATFDVRAGDYPELRAHDGYVITGSRHSVYDAIDWLPRLGAFVERAASADCRIVGVCFGHQLLAQLFGGRVEKMGWTVGVQAADILHHEPWMVPAMGEVRLLASHQDQVVALPPGASVFAGSGRVRYGGFTLGEQILTIQGHPEFTKDYARALLNFRRDLLGQDAYRQGIGSLNGAVDSGLVARWMLRFLSQ